MSRDHHSSLLDVTVDAKNTASSIVACWTLFTKLLPGNAMIKSVTIFYMRTINKKIKSPMGVTTRHRDRRQQERELSFKPS
jgi:hypothetical protein